MEFKSQLEPLEALRQLSNSRRNSIVISGPGGSGKTHLAKTYGKLCGCEDVIFVSPTVGEVRDAVSFFYTVESNILAVFENLDDGLPGASYALLKFLEEPLSNVFLVVTCRNLRGLPDTIASRAAVVELGPPTLSDIVSFAVEKDKNKFESVSKCDVWNVVRSFSDVDLLYSMSTEKLAYFDFIASKLHSKESVSTLSWMLGHYQDNSETPVELVIRYILCKHKDKYIQSVCLDCLKDLRFSRIASSSVLSKLAFELKYGG